MMHYGFCRKHADQTGEGGCPECAMDHQQATISAMTETAKEANRVHIEMHNQNVALQAEVARLTDCLKTANGHHEHFERRWYLCQDRIAELEATQAEHDRELDLQCKATEKIATEAALRWAWVWIYETERGKEGFIQRGLAALLGEGEK